jgi:hypothetical protein
MTIMVRIGDLVQRTRDGRICRVLCDQTNGRLGDAVRDLHHACGDEEREFLG